MKKYFILLILLFTIKAYSQTVTFTQDTSSNYYKTLTFPSSVRNFIFTNDDAANTVLITSDTTSGQATVLKAGEVLTFLNLYVPTITAKWYYKSQTIGQVIILRSWGY